MATPDVADFDRAVPGQGERIARAAARDMTVLLTGETGTGKTRLARQIHDHSPRRDAPFLVVNCGALSENLIESELFGHVRGAFTGADRDRTGKFAEAGAGTILLDDVDALPPGTQAKLLRVVEARVFEPVGSNKSQPVRARLIAASNRDLRREADRGRFRADLYYRLAVVGFALPPLRDRIALVPDLVAAFVADLGSPLGVDAEVMAVLTAYDWPGNIRELRNAVEHAVALGGGPTIAVHDLPPDLVGIAVPGWTPPAAPAGPPPESPLDRARQEAERRVVVDALMRCRGNRTRAARAVGVSRMTFYNLLRRHGLQAGPDAQAV